MVEESLLENFQAFLLRIKATPVGSLIARGDEFRSSLIKTTLVFFGTFALVVAFAKPLFQILKGPLEGALPKGAATLHFTGPLEVFLAYVKVGFLAAAVITAPFALFQIWTFLKPSLPEQQRRHIVPFFAISMLLFIGGGAFCFFGILPTTLQTLIGMGDNIAKPLITVDDYISLVVFMMLGFGLVFQLPLVLIILERLGVISAHTLASNRGGMLVGILIVAAVATPTPDPFSQIAMAAPMYMMFEVAILAIRWLQRQDRPS